MKKETKEILGAIPNAEIKAITISPDGTVKIELNTEEKPATAVINALAKIMLGGIEFEKLSETENTSKHKVNLNDFKEKTNGAKEATEFNEKLNPDAAIITSIKVETVGHLEGLAFETFKNGVENKHFISMTNQTPHEVAFHFNEIVTAIEGEEWTVTTTTEDNKHETIKGLTEEQAIKLKDEKSATGKYKNVSAQRV